MRKPAGGLGTFVMCFIAVGWLSPETPEMMPETSCGTVTALAGARRSSPAWRKYASFVPNAFCACSTVPLTGM